MGWSLVQRDIRVRGVDVERESGGDRLHSGVECLVESVFRPGGECRQRSRGAGAKCGDEFLQQFPDGFESPIDEVIRGTGFCLYAPSDCREFQVFLFLVVVFGVAHHAGGRCHIGCLVEGGAGVHGGFLAVDFGFQYVVGVGQSCRDIGACHGTVEAFPIDRGHDAAFHRAHRIRLVEILRRSSGDGVRGAFGGGDVHAICAGAYRAANDKHGVGCLYAQCHMADSAGVLVGGSFACRGIFVDSTDVSGFFRGVCVVLRFGVVGRLSGRMHAGGKAVRQR